MKGKDGKEKSFEQAHVHVLNEQPSKTRIVELRVVHWIVDGKDTGPKMEKRIFHILKNGEKRLGKCSGLNRKDLEYIVENWEEIRIFFPS